MINRHNVFYNLENLVKKGSKLPIRRQKSRLVMTAYFIYIKNLFCFITMINIKCIIIMADIFWLFISLKVLCNKCYHYNQITKSLSEELPNNTSVEKKGTIICQYINIRNRIVFHHFMILPDKSQILKIVCILI